MKIKRVVLFVLPLMLIVLALVPSIKIQSVDAVSSSAKAMCVLDKDSKRVLYSKNEHEKLPMASTTKVVTAITVINNCKNLDELITVNDSSIGVEGTSIYLRKGEQLKVIDLLYGLMLRSGNDSAVALACHIGGDVDNFAKMMTDYAKSVGANNSNFANPHGLDNVNHYTTAYDLALITSNALENEVFSKIVSTKSYVIEATNISDKRYLTNKNRLLSSLEGCCGVKTGFTKKAGRCLVSSVTRKNATRVCVVLNCGPMFEESASTLNSSYSEYENTQIIDKNKEIYNEYIINENQGKLYLYAGEDYFYPLGFGENNNLRLEYNVALKQASEGDEVGEIKVFFDKDLIKTIKLYTMNKIDKLIDSETLKINEVLWEEKINEN